MAFKIGITGGIGSGKSVVSHLLQIMGIPVYDTDSEAKQLTRSDETIREHLISLVGKDVYKDGTLNKSFLASFLFANPENAAKVNAIIHPRVKEHFMDWSIRKEFYNIIAIESAILVESGFGTCVDKIVLVTAPLELRLQRAISRDCSSKDSVMKRILSQVSDKERERYADFVITNDDKTPLIPQVVRMIEQLK